MELHVVAAAAWVEAVVVYNIRVEGVIVWAQVEAAHNIHLAAAEATKGLSMEEV